jgi:large subunit ribosomal protein L25
VLYGHGEAPKHIALPAREFAAAIRHGGVNQVFNITLADGTEALALPKAIQRDPLRDTFEHVDLLIVRRGETVTVEVPVRLIGEAARGTLIINEHDRLSITAEALHLPEFLEASIEGMEPGSHVTAADIKLPSGVDLAVDPETIIAVISVAASAEQLEGEGVGEGPEAPAARVEEEWEAAPDTAPAPPAEGENAESTG